MKNDKLDFSQQGQIIKSLSNENTPIWKGRCLDGWVV